MATDLSAVAQPHKAIRSFGASADCLLRRKYLHAKAARLRHGAPRQVRARKSRGESEIVFNPGAHSGLAARSLSLNHHRAQSLARAIHGGGKSGRSASDNCQIIELSNGMTAQTDALRYLGGCRLFKPLAVR